MKKLLILLLCLFTTDSFATGIGNVSSAPCDNETLSKYTGTANVEINWEPNTIGLKWFNGDEQIAGQTSCVYDGTITVPPAPTKPGYTFNGWKVIRETCGIEQLNTETNGIDYSYIEQDGTSRLADRYGLTDNGAWAAEFGYGVIYGLSMCSTKYGTYTQTDFPADEVGKYCWCKAIGFTPTSNDYTNGASCKISPLNALWVFHEFQGEKKDCVHLCALNCSFYVFFRVAFRAPFYDSVTPQQ